MRGEEETYESSLLNSSPKAGEGRYRSRSLTDMWYLALLFVVAA